MSNLSSSSVSSSAATGAAATVAAGTTKQQPKESKPKFSRVLASKPDAPYVNSVLVVGKVCTNPVEKEGKDGRSKLCFWVVTLEPGKNGQSVADYHYVLAYGNKINELKKPIKAGMVVQIRGRLRSVIGGHRSVFNYIIADFLRPENTSAVK